MNSDRRKQLEVRLQSVLGELSVLCNELGIEIGSVGGGGPARGDHEEPGEHREGPLLIARCEELNIGFIASDVQELVRMATLTDPVEPRPEVLGFINVRGVAIPVLNLRHLLGLESLESDPEQSLVILKVERGRVAVVVDEIVDIYDLSSDNYQDRDELEIRRGFINGVARIEDRLVAVLHPVLLARHAL